MKNTCPNCKNEIQELTVTLETNVDIKPAWQITCPDCSTNLTMIETQKMRDITPLE